MMEWRHVACKWPTNGSDIDLMSTRDGHLALWTLPNGPMLQVRTQRDELESGDTLDYSRTLRLAAC